LQLLQPRGRRLALWILIAFASPVLIYASIFWEHTLTTALCLGAAWLSFQIGPIGRAASFRQIIGWAIIGLILAISAYIRSETVFFALAWLLAYWLLIPRGRWGVVWAGISLGVMLLLYVPLHRAMFGQTEKIFHSSFLSGFHPLSYLERAGWQVIPDLLIGAPEDGAIAGGWLSWIWAIATIAAVGFSFVPNSRLAHNLMLLVLGLSALVGATFLFNPTPYRSAHGLLFTTPWIALGLCRAKEVWRRGDWRIQVIVLSTILGLTSYLLALIVIRAPHWGPHGALEWGMRYVMTFYPFLAIMAAWNLQAKWRDISSLVIIGALVFLGVGFQIRGLWTIRHDKQINARLNQILAEAPGQYIVSDLWWLPLNAAPIQPQKTVFFALPNRMADWVSLAAAAQAQQFFLVTLNPSLLEEAGQRLGSSNLTPLEEYNVENLIIFHVALEGR
ncbi:MAG TPA: hypothetical protein VEC96_16080, partial [Anaerolineae bacterium]|nr:hypothetical protein [Anaerolineae bacterium]